MIKQNKVVIYIKHLLLMSTVNKVRIVLTAIGLFVAVLIFAIGIIAANSYYQKKLSVISEIQRNTMAVNYDSSSSEKMSEVISLMGVMPVEDIMLQDSKAIFSKEISNGRFLNVFASFHGINTLEEINPLISNDENIYISNKTILKEGRLFTKKDIQDKNLFAVIDEITARILFPDESAIGKTITVKANVNGSGISQESTEDEKVFQLQIIGIIENSSIMQERLMLLKKALNQTQDNLFFETQVYFPISLVNEYFKDDEKVHHLVFSFDSADKLKQAVKSMNSLIEINAISDPTLSYITYQNQKEIIEKDLQTTKTSLNLITLFLCIISGISIMSITFFSIKERVREIGVKKAFGATNIDIIFQFIFEMVFIALFTSVIATCCGVILCKLISLYLYEYHYIIFPLAVGVQQLLLPIMVGVLEAVLCSIVPSFYASKIEVTEALRFE